MYRHHMAITQQPSSHQATEEPKRQFDDLMNSNLIVKHKALLIK